jgi:hypothetical protein
VGPAVPALPEREDVEPDPVALALVASAAIEQAGASVAVRRRIAALAALARRSAALARPVSAPRLAKLLEALVAADVTPDMLQDSFFETVPQ